MISWGRRILERTGRRIGELFSAVVSPVERLIAGTFRGAFAAFERIEGSASSGFGRLVQIVLWPFRFVGRLCAFLLPAPVYQAFARGWGGMVSVGHKIVDSLLWVAGKLNLDWLVQRCVWLLQPIWRPLAALWSMMIGWLVTREYRAALWGIPAVAMVLVVGGFGLWNWRYGQSSNKRTYRVAVRDALEAQDYELAQLYERKLAQLGVNTQLTKYRTALTLAQEDNLVEAYNRMQLLAPENQVGYPAAHFWIAQQMLVGNLIADRTEGLRLAKVHLDRLESAGLTGPNQQLLKALWLIQNEQFDEASAILQPLTATLPSAAFQRMRIDVALQRTEEAKRDARALVSHMSSLSRKRVELGATEYQWWLAAEEVLGNFEQMHRILDQWHALEPENDQAKQMLARVCRREAVQLLRDPLPDEERIVELWLTAAEMDDSTEALVQLAQALYKNRGRTPVFRRILTTMVQSPRTPVELLVAVGTEAAIAEEFVESRQFFAAAVQRDATHASAWNNYGYVLARGEDAQLEDALAAVNRALEMQPKEYRFRETRGQILLYLERWKESVEDLEFALNGMPHLVGIHKSLAEAYTAMGDDELASLHRAHIE